MVLSDKDVIGFDPSGLLPQPLEEVAKIQRFLRPIDYNSESSEYNKHLASYIPGTGEWIQETEQYQKWLSSSDHGTLWIKAIAGAGKSVVAAHLAHQLSRENVPVLHFFFRQIITTNQCPESLARDFMSQVLEHSPLLQSELKQYLEKQRKLERIAFDKVWEKFVSTMSKTPRSYCIIGALDEMDTGNDSFIQKLIQLVRESPSPVKVLITGRPLLHRKGCERNFCPPTIFTPTPRRSRHCYIR